MLTFDEYKKATICKKYAGKKITCAMPGCHNYAEYEIGDSRCYFLACEEHSGIRAKYDMYVEYQKRKREVRLRQAKTAPQDTAYNF